MSGRLDRLLRPRSVAVIGGGAWGRNVVRALREMGYPWDVWPVHPTAEKIEGVQARRDLSQLPRAPDAVFVGVNRNATIGVIEQLSAMGAGGAVCFASGFGEAGDGAALNAALLDAAGDMPVIGPNCYGFVNALDRAALWPDTHGLVPVKRGVAILTQSSNIALNLTMQRRGLPIAYVATAGNQAQTGLADLGAAMLADPRVSALGLHVEGFGDLRPWEALSAEAARLGKPVVVLKAGRSAAAQAATVSHTASIAGSDAGAGALIDRLGFARAETLPGLLEALKLLHVVGPLPVPAIASLSCSGGEASLMADAADRRGITFPPLRPQQAHDLSRLLGPLVRIDNPLDYHTFIWGDTDRMAQVFAAMMRGDALLTCVIADFPHEIRSDGAAWECIIDAAAQARAAAGLPLALVSTLPDTLPEAMVERLRAADLLPLCGLEAALEGIAIAALLGRQSRHPAPLLLPRPGAHTALIDEAAAKTALAGHGLDVPRGRVWPAPAIAEQGPGPYVLKRLGTAHKTEAGAVALSLSATDLPGAARAMGQGPFLVEEQVTGALAELLVGIVADPAHGYVLTLGAGGTAAELAQDSVSLLVPSPPEEIAGALRSLRLWPLLDGYRGRPRAAQEAVVAAIRSVQDYVTAQAGRVAEVEINPLIVTATRAVAADALLRLWED